jgi:hypothetical protein
MPKEETKNFMEDERGEINFTGISDIIQATTGIIPDLVDLIVNIAPLKIVQAIVAGVVGLVIGIAKID